MCLQMLCVQLGDGWAGSALGQRLEVVGQFEILNVRSKVRCKRSAVRLHHTPHPTASAAAASNSAADQNMPERYFVVEDTKCVRLRSLLVWTDGFTPTPLTAPTTHSASATSTTSALPHSLPTSSVTSVLPPAPLPAVAAATAPPRSRSALFIVGYALLLLAIALSQVDWRKWKRVWRRALAAH